MQIENSLFELILISIGKRTSLSQSLSDNDWRILYTEVEKQSLIGVLYCCIEILPTIQRPPIDILMEWIGQTEKIKAQNEIVNKEKGVNTVVIVDGILTDEMFNELVDKCIDSDNSDVVMVNSRMTLFDNFNSGFFE